MVVDLVVLGSFAFFFCMNCHNDRLFGHTESNLVDFNLNYVQAWYNGGCSMNLLKRSIHLNYGDIPSCCLTSMPPIAILSHSSDNHGYKLTNANSNFSLGSTYEFGMDNCATHHIC